MYQASNYFLLNQAILFREKQRKTIRFQTYTDILTQCFIIIINYENSILSTTKKIMRIV